MKGAAGIRTKDSFCFQTRENGPGFRESRQNMLNVLDRDKTRAGGGKSHPSDIILLLSY